MTKSILPFPIPPVDDRPLHDAIWTRYAFPVLALAHEVGLFEHLAERPATIEAIANWLDVAPRAAEAMVAVVAALGFLTRQDDGQFTVTEVARTYLVPSSPLYSGVLLRQDEALLDQLRQAFRASREPIAPLSVTMDTLTPRAIREFITSMHAIARPAASKLASQEVFSRVRRLLDVGGGSGALSMAIAAQHPGIQCTIMDLDPVCAIARENVVRAGLADRITTVSADMLRDPWPQGYDAVLFGDIFEGWDVETCQFLSQRAFDMLEPGGVICLHEMPLHEGKDGPLTVACLSVVMLLHEKGKQYTASELETLLSEAGFIDFRGVPTFGYFWLFTATKSI